VAAALLAVADVALRLERVADVALRLERVAVARSVQEAKEEAKVARDAFEDARQQLERDAEEAATLAGAAVRRATATVIDPRAERLRESLPATLLAGTDADWQGTLAMAAAWTREAEAALAGALAEALDRHADRLQERVNRFVQQAGAAFGSRCRRRPMSARAFRGEASPRIPTTWRIAQARIFVTSSGRSRSRCTRIRDGSQRLM
jgi:hypothetical protein